MSTYIREEHLARFRDPARAEAFVREVLSKGYVIILDFLTPDTMTHLMEETADRTVGNKKNQELEGSWVHKLAVSDEMMEVLQTIHANRLKIEGKPIVPLKLEKQSWGYPYKNAKDGAKTIQTHYHYDAAYTNTLIPLVLPPSTSGQGHLVAYPNLRTKMPSLLSKIVSRILRDVPFMRTIFPGVTVPYTVGGFHFFFGDISFHGVEPITEGERLVITINSHW